MTSSIMYLIVVNEKYSRLEMDTNKFEDPLPENKLQPFQNDN